MNWKSKFWRQRIGLYSTYRSASPTPAQPTQTESRTYVNSLTDPYPATGSTQARDSNGTRCSGLGSLFDNVLSLNPTQPLPEGESESVPRGLVMASCLPAAHASDYMCIEFFMEFCIDGLLLYFLSRRCQHNWKGPLILTGFVGKEFRAMWIYHVLIRHKSFKLLRKVFSPYSWKCSATFLYLKYI